MREKERDSPGAGNQAATRSSLSNIYRRKRGKRS